MVTRHCGCGRKWCRRSDRAADGLTLSPYSDAMEQLVTTDWLADELGAKDLVVLDCTVYSHVGNGSYVAESGRANFETGHIPGAGFADLIADLADVDSPWDFALPTSDAFGVAMERLGVADGRRVVLYDDSGSRWASRVWFMLRWIGFDDAAILDGGLKAWGAEGRALDTGPAGTTPRTSGSLSLAPRPHLVADKAEVMAAIDDGATCIVDAMPGEIFRGEVRPYERGGHIPGAISIPANSMVDAGTGRFLPLDDVRAMFPDRPEARVVAY
jgi:thiosulfate/3-mercaptopyruvate sulfurtransferase